MYMMLLFWIFCDILSLNVKMHLCLKLYTVPFFVSGQTYKISKGSNNYFIPLYIQFNIHFWHNSPCVEICTCCSTALMWLSK